MKLQTFHSGYWYYVSAISAHNIVTGGEDEALSADYLPVIQAKWADIQFRGV